MSDRVDALMGDDEAVTPQPASEPMPSVRAGTRSFAIMQALRMIVAFGISAFVSRQLGPEGKGALALVQQVPSLLALVLGFGFAGVNVYYVGRGKRTAGEALGDSLTISTFALVVGVPASVFAMSLMPALDALDVTLLVLSSAVVPVGVFSSQLAGILVGQGRPELQSRAQSVAAVLNLALVGALYASVRLSVEAVVAASLAATMVSILMMLVPLRARPVFAGFRARVTDAFPYASKRYVMELAAMLEMRVDIVMLGLLSTAAVTGLYSVAVSLAELLWFIPRAAETPLLSRLLKEEGESGVGLVVRTVRLTVLLEVVMLAGAAILLKPAVLLVFGPSFVGATTIFWILAPGVVMNGLVGPLIAYLTSRGHQFPRLSTATVAGNVALNAVLIPMVGGPGAALASSVTYGLGSVWLIWRFRAETKCGLAELLVPRAADLSVLLGRRAR